MAAGTRALTEMKRKFADAYWDSCKPEGDLTTGNIKAAALVAGYSSWKTGYQFMSAGGEVKDEAIGRYFRERMAALNGLKTPATMRAKKVAPDHANGSYDDIDDADINALRRIRDDEDAPHGARVRAAELLMKQKGIDKPTGDEDVEDPEAALQAILVMLGVEEVDPVNFTMGQATSWTLPAPKSSTPTCEPTSTIG